MTKHAREDERPNTLDAVNAFTREVTLPTEWAHAVMAGRSELLRLAPLRGLTLAEVENVRDAIGTFMETNRALQDHCKTLAMKLDQLRDMLKGVVTVAEQAHDLAEFRQPLESYE